jgi:hypothetical protein
VVDRAGVAAAATALVRAGETGGDLCEPFLRVFDVNGAAVSTLGEPFGTETVCASGEQAARRDEIQIDLGEGPCWQALAHREAVLEPDLENTTTTSWPLALGALQETGLGAVFAFPLVVAGIDVGAIDLYFDVPTALTEQQIADATMLSMVLARQVFHRAVHASEHGDAVSDTFSRREVHQATGMVLAQMHSTSGDALLILRGHAFASGRTVLDVAADVIDRRLDFSTTH